MTTKTGRSRTARSEKKVCSACGQAKSLKNDYFVSYNPLHKDGKIPICKSCIRQACLDEKDEFSIDKFMSLLRQLDKPFIPTLWDKSESELRKKTKNQSDEISWLAVVGVYLKNIAMHQYQGLTWADSNDVNSISTGIDGVESGRRKMQNTDRVFYLSNEEFEVTESIIRLFGEGYTAKEYEIMQRIYDDMRQEYPNITTNQKNLLLRYVRLAAKEEVATSNGFTVEAEKWAKLATEAYKQLNSIDTQDGISSFSEFFRDFERVKDISRILPKFKYRPNDAPDFIIWCYVNYCRRLEGKPEVEYADVYRFYDEKVNEYLKQYGDPYGIFTDDTTWQNRERIQEFIELPPDYNGDGD